MERVIKFKVEEIKTNKGLCIEEIVDGNWTHWYNRGENFLERITDKGVMTFLFPVRRRMFTGLIDDNEVDIYEGDIVSDILGNYHLVQWNDDTCKFQFDNGTDINDGDNYSTHKVIVGNIHQNPELLNK